MLQYYNVYISKLVYGFREILVCDFVSSFDVFCVLVGFSKTSFYLFTCFLCAFFLLELDCCLWAG